MYLYRSSEAGITQASTRLAAVSFSGRVRATTAPQICAV